jgi:sigma-B regulation protein RsbU (phosphoserine phosphatase)
MARISSDLRMAAVAGGAPADVLQQVNRSMLARSQYESFVTVIYMTLDVKTHQVVIANAGHEPVLVRHRRGEVERIDGTDPALGIFEDARYHNRELQLQAPDALVLCTDGIVEATSPGGEQFGFDRLIAAIDRGGARAEELTARVLSAVGEHVGDAPAYDDLTLLTCSTFDGDEDALKSAIPAPVHPRRLTGELQTSAVT